MNTKYGEVKSRLDLFGEDTEIGRSSTNAGDAITVESKCKICGDTVSGLSFHGMGYSGGFIEDKKREHINLHTDLGLIKLSTE